MPGHTLETFPDSIAAIVAGGHELASPRLVPRGLLGRSPVDEQREILARSFEALERAAGVHRAAGGRRTGRSASGRSSSSRRPGSGYDSSLMSRRLRAWRGFAHGDRHSTTDGTRWGRESGLVEVPVYWALDDWPHFEPAPATVGTGWPPPSKVLEIWTEELRYAWEHAPGGLLTVTMHPGVHRARPPDGDAGTLHRRGQTALDGVVFDRLDRYVERPPSPN